MRYLLIDRITQVVPWKSAAGLKSVALAEDFFTDHFPERPVMPGVLMIEALAQLSNWLIAASTDFRQGARIASIGNAKFRKFVSPGTQLRLSVAIEESGADEEQGAERIKVAGRVSAEGLTVTQAELFIVRDSLLEQAESARQRQLFRALLQE